MADIDVVEWDHVLADPPGAGSQATASQAYTADRLYLVCATQMRTDDTDPAVPTIAGLGATWTAINGDEAYWDSTSSSRRRTDLWWGVPASSGTGAITVSYASDAGSIDIMVQEVDGADDIVQIVDSNHSIFASSLVEPLTLATPASASNRICVFAIGNTASTAARLELSADEGGEVNWTSFSDERNPSAPTSINVSGWYDGPCTDDLTPGWYADTTSNAYMVAVEVSATLVSTAGTPVFGLELAFSAIVPPSGVNFLIGAGVGDSTDGGHPARTAAWEARVGGRHMQIGRRYASPENSPIVDITSSSAGNGANEMSQDINVRHRAISQKEPAGSDLGVTQAQWETTIASIPVDGYITWITAHHEPDNDYKSDPSHDATWFLTKCVEPMHAAWVAQGSRSDVKPYVCYTVSNYAQAVAMFPASNMIADFAMLLDPYFYDPGAWNTLQNKCEPFVTAWKAAGGSAWGIGEIGHSQQISDPVNRDLEDWIHQSIQWMRSDPDAIIFLWWDEVGVTADFRLRDTPGLTALGEEMDLTAP